MSKEFRFKNIDEPENHRLEEIKQNDVMSRKYRKVCTTLNFIEHFPILPFTITGCIPIFAFDSLLGNPIGSTSSATGLKIYVIAARIEKYNSIIKKNKNKHDKKYY